MYGRNPFENDDDNSFEAHANRQANAMKSSGGSSLTTANGTKKVNSGNPFYDDGKDDFYSPPSSSSANSEYSNLQQKVQSSMNRQLETTNRCLASLYDSESVGIATAEELVRQGEKLDNAERNIDKIISDTKTSQRHLNSIKSVFGGFKNWWNGEKKDSQPVTQPTRDRTNTTLGKALNNQTSTKDTHPALTSKGYDTKGFFDDDVVEFDHFDPDSFGNKPNNNTRSASMGQIKQQQQQQKQQQQQQSSSSSRSKEWQEYERGLEKNLDLMSSGLSNLKVLAQGLGEEIEVQNEQLDRISGKADRADTKIRNQNLQMKRILGK
ncbi:hypothetical protein HELRODRAFT_184904 [Helobdella robusta]|uniref:t-SNARE coiled-coil homology domain-containing protein n=1 Tax=Helobdella robusta TaxID=6412 RepID=T1FM55_HELRO|nr:hypothetical protein HELRODRAFT_184904 [Helobdella robusta]ESO05944.1 hypothetical protein HELRODRAFT_184904 [Helobdella robusta]